jgi:heptaprenyl diphosphate synthase
MIPKPLPFIRLGLANFPLLLALDLLSFPSLMLLSALKIIGQALISGTLFSYVFLFSLGGTEASILIMYAFRKVLGKRRISLIGVSAAGAMASNGVTLLMAYFFVFGPAIRYAAVPVLALGLATGTILGIFSEYFIGQSRWYTAWRVNADLNASCRVQPEETHILVKETAAALSTQIEVLQARYSRKARETFCEKSFAPTELAIAGLCIMPALLFNRDSGALLVQLLYLILLAWLSGKKNKLLFTLLVMTGIIFFNLLIPYGEILFSIGPLSVTSGALDGGIRRAAMLESLFMLSRCCIRRDLVLPGSFGEMIADAFRVFSFLTEDNKTFDRKNWAARLDELLIGYSKSGTEAKKEPEPKKPRLSNKVIKFTSRIILVVVVILAWLPLLISKKSH